MKKIRMPLEKKIRIAFEFRGNLYEAIIRVKKKSGDREFIITALNWQLERLLYGNQVIKEIGGGLQANIQAERKDQTELKLVIAAGLSKYLKTPCFAGDCLLGEAKEEGWEDLHPIPRHEPHHLDGSRDSRDH